jgi:hypothetical protein
MSLNDILNTSNAIASISVDTDVCKDDAKPECLPPSSSSISTSAGLEGDKVNITIKSCKSISSKQALLIIPITKYFSDRRILNKLITILKGEGISLRLVDWFVTNYCKKHNVMYNVMDFRPPVPGMTEAQRRSFDNFIIVHTNYKGQLKAYSKRNFDPFCRRNRIRFYYEENKYFITTVGQLNFFKWALENNIVDYVQKHMKEIEDDMNLRCENIKKPGTKIAKAASGAGAGAGADATVAEDDGTRNDEHGTGSGVGSAGSTVVGTRKNKPQDGTITVTTEKGIKTKKAPGTRKKRKEISQSASKSLSIHNLPTTLVFD